MREYDKVSQAYSGLTLGPDIGGGARGGGTPDGTHREWQNKFQLQIFWAKL